MKNIVIIKKSLIIFLFTLLCIPVLGNTLEKRPSAIELAGTCETHENRSLVYPLEAFQNGDQVLVTFFDATADVTISITKDADSIETRTISFEEFQTEVFDISQYGAGSYTLLITTTRGTYLYGTFYL